MNTNRLIFLTAIILYSISAIFNTGYYHYDEHFQIIEFAELKTGVNAQTDLAWEYNEELRPALQPLLAYWILTFLRSLNVNDPYTIMTIFRLMTVILSVMTINWTVSKTEFLFAKPLHLYYRLLSFFLFFLPFINCRFSSETYSGITFMLAIALYYSNISKKFLLIGILLTLSFIFRFQTGLMAGGFVLWLLLIKRIGYKLFLELLLGSICILSLNLIVDYWFYGKLTIPFVNYFIVNLVEGVASEFGVNPWYYYFNETNRILTPFVGLLILGCCIYQVIDKPKSWLTWVLIPFIAVHISIPHKELRFLFPIVNLLPLVLMSSIARIVKFKFLRKNGYKNIILPVLIICVLLNSIAIGLMILMPADGHGRANITHSIQNLVGESKSFLLVSDYNNPYNPIPVEQNFYKNRFVNVSYLDSLKEITYHPGALNLVTMNGNRLGYWTTKFKGYDLIKISSGIPEGLLAVRRILSLQSAESLMLYRFEPKHKNIKLN